MGVHEACDLGKYICALGFKSAARGLSMVGLKCSLSLMIAPGSQFPS